MAGRILGPDSRALGTACAHLQMELNVPVVPEVSLAIDVDP